MPTPGVGCWLCPGILAGSLVLVGAPERDGKRQDWGLSAVPLTSTCSPCAGWPMGHGTQAGSSEQPVP